MEDVSDFVDEARKQVESLVGEGDVDETGPRVLEAKGGTILAATLSKDVYGEGDMVRLDVHFESDEAVVDWEFSLSHSSDEVPDAAYGCTTFMVRDQAHAEAQETLDCPDPEMTHESKITLYAQLQEQAAVGPWEAYFRLGSEGTDPDTRAVYFRMVVPFEVGVGRSDARAPQLIQGDTSKERVVDGESFDLILELAEESALQYLQANFVHEDGPPQGMVVKGNGREYLHWSMEPEAEPMEADPDGVLRVVIPVDTHKEARDSDSDATGLRPGVSFSARFS